MSANRYFISFAVLLTLLFGGSLAATAGVGSSNGFAVSRFEEGAEGWSLWNNSQAIQQEAPGYISAPDAATPWYWNAPSAFLGDQSAAMGGLVSFLVRDDLKAGPSAEGPGLLLMGGGSTLAHRGKPRKEGDGPWLTVTAHFHEMGGWYHPESGQPATLAELRLTLSQLDRLLVRGTWHTGATWGALKQAALLPGDTFQLSAQASGVKVKISPKKLNFPTTYATDTERITFTITNSGTQPAVLTVPDALFEGFSWFAKPPATVAPRATVTGTIEFESSILGRHDGTIAIGVAGQSKPLILKLIAFNKSPLEVTPGQVKFGKVATGSEKSVPIRVKNNSTRFIDLRCELSGGAQNQFVVVNDDDSLPPGSERTLTATYRPFSQGKHSAVLRVYEAYEEVPWEGSVKLDGEGRGLPRAPRIVTNPPETISFGPEVVIGQAPPTNTVTVSNTGNLDLRVEPILAPAAPFEFRAGAGLADPAQAQVIPPNGTITYGLRYAPTEAGENLDFIAIHSNDPESPDKYITLTGSARRPDEVLFDIDRTEIDFGTYAVDEFEPPYEQWVEITNLGDSDLEIEIGAVAGPFSSESQALHVTGGGRAGNKFFFKPLSAGSYETEVTLTTNDPTRPTVVITLRGTAIARDEIAVPKRTRRRGPARAARVPPVSQRSRWRR